MAKAKVKKPASLSLEDVVLVEDEPPRKPVRVLTQKQVLKRLKTTVPTLNKYERLGLIPRARDVCGKTVYIEHEIDQAITSAPFRKLKGDAA